MKLFNFVLDVIVIAYLVVWVWGTLFAGWHVHSPSAMLLYTAFMFTGAFVGV
jgi:hypothetical protein